MRNNNNNRINRRHYNRNFKGNKWTVSRKLSEQWTKKFNKTGQHVWREMGTPNGSFSELKEKIAIHNRKVRRSWKKPGFNKRERVLEIHNNYHSGVTTVKHVDSETAVKENTFTSHIDPAHHDVSLDQHVFGNSELSARAFDSWSLCETTSLAAYYDAVNLVIQALA